MSSQLDSFISTINNHNSLSKKISPFKVPHTKKNLILSKYLYSQGLIQNFQLIQNQIILQLNYQLIGKKLIKKLSKKKIKNALKVKDMVYLTSLNSSLVISSSEGYQCVEYLKKNKKGGIPVYKVI